MATTVVVLVVVVVTCFRKMHKALAVLSAKL